MDINTPLPTPPAEGAVPVSAGIALSGAVERLRTIVPAVPRPITLRGRAYTHTTDTGVLVRIICSDLLGNDRPLLALGLYQDSLYEEIVSYTGTSLTDGTLNLLTAPQTEWDKLPVDTPINVSFGDNKQLPRHFARFEDGIVYFYPEGMTSWTCKRSALAAVSAEVAVSVTTATQEGT